MNIPNMLTLFRMALLPVVVWRYRQGDLHGALAVYLTAMITDAADGVIARQCGQVTALGKLLDPIADKTCLFTVLALFAADGQISVSLLNVVVLKEAALILGSIAALKAGIVVSALPIGKLTTLAFVFATIARFLALNAAADILLWGSAALSLVSLIWYLAAFVRQLQMQKAMV